MLAVPAGLLGGMEPRMKLLLEAAVGKRQKGQPRVTAGSPSHGGHRPNNTDSTASCLVRRTAAELCDAVNCQPPRSHPDL